LVIGDHYDVVASRQAGEVVLSVRVGVGAGHEGVGDAVVCRVFPELYPDAGDSGLSVLGKTIVVVVDPDEVADLIGRHLDEAEVD